MRDARRTSAAVLALVLLAVLVAACSKTVDGHPDGLAGAPGSAGSTSSSHPGGTGTVPDFTKGVVVGSGSVHVLAYADLACPPCARLESTLAPVITAEVAKGGVQLTFVDVAFLDRVSNGTRYSSRAANAALCAAQVGTTQFLAFQKAILAKQPSEGTPGLTDPQIIAVATASGITSSDYATCVTGSRFSAQVQTATHVAEAAKIMAVPSISVNGTTLVSPTGATVQRAITSAR